MRELAQHYETQFFIYQFLFLLNIFLAIIASIYVLKNRSRLKNPYLILLSIYFIPFIVSISIILDFNKKSDL
jgi:glucan phosphoethanolaminetransferase (alkaline phosphatase superfamily)